MSDDDRDSFAPARDGDHFFMVARDWLAVVPVATGTAICVDEGADIDKVPPPSDVVRALIARALTAPSTPLDVKMLARRAQPEHSVFLVGQHFDPVLVRMGPTFARAHGDRQVQIGRCTTGGIAGVSGDLPPEVPALVIRGARWVLMVTPMNLAKATPIASGGVA